METCFHLYGVYTLHKTSFPLGNSTTLPNFIRKHKSIISLYTNPSNGKAYEDYLCMFRCLAYHVKKSIYGLESLVKNNYSQWVKYVKEQNLKTTDVNVSNICDIKNCFQVNINVFSLSNDKTVTVIYISRKKYKNNTLNLNLYENHLSYIIKFNSYSSKFTCKLCHIMFPTSFRLDRHTKSCQKATRLKFPGGYYKQKKTIFDKLEKFNIFVEHELRHYPWVSVFDLESVLIPETSNSTSKRNLLNSHKPICVCIASNVSGFEKEKYVPVFVRHLR